MGMTAPPLKWLPTLCGLTIQGDQEDCGSKQRKPLDINLKKKQP